VTESLTSDKARRLIMLKGMIEHYKENLRIIEQEYAGLEQEILERMLAEGVTRLGVDDYTVGSRTDTYPRPRNGQEALCAALKETGLGGLVKEAVNLSTLRSHVIEQEKIGKPLPPQLDAEIELTRVHRVTLNKARS
jgi:hypothetical protein